jgi:hypothetical protein
MVCVVVAVAFTTAADLECAETDNSYFSRAAVGSTGAEAGVKSERSSDAHETTILGTSPIKPSVCV